MSRVSRWAAWTALSLSLLQAGCGASSAGGALRHDFPDDRVDDVRAVMARLAAAPARNAAPVAVGVSPAPVRVFAFDLASGTRLWEHEVDVETVPHIGGDVVITHEAAGIVVRALRSGATISQFPDAHMSLQGVDGEGDLAALVLSTGGAVSARSRLVVLRGGREAWSLDSEHAMGAPAVRAGMIFLPWARQNLTVIDATTGTEIARVRVQRGVIGHAVAEGNDVYFGQSGITRFDENARPGEDAPWFEPHERPLPAEPPMLRDAYAPAPSAASAMHRVRLVWQASGAADALRVLDDTIYLVFYRVIFALAAREDAVRWVAVMPRDVVGAEVEEGGLVLADNEGTVYLLSRETGQITRTLALGVPATYVRIQHPAITPGEGAGPTPPPFHEQLVAAAQNTDARLVPARAYAARLLATIRAPEATEALVVLCDDRTLPADLRTASCAALATREEGASYVIAALERHASYLQRSTAPPVGALAQAAARMGEQQAVPLLIAHLRDPETPAADLAPLVESLQTLGAASAAEPIGDFLRLYHAESEDEALGAALARAVNALVAIQGPAAREALQAIVDDSSSMAAARAAAARALDGLEPGGDASAGASASTTTSDTPAEGGGESGGESGAGGAASAALPAHLTTQMVAEVLHPVERELRACLVQPGRVHGSARVVLVIEPNGEVALVSVTPHDLQACIEPLVRQTAYPLTRARGRQHVTHTVRR